MAGPIQTALNKLIGVAAGGAVAGKKYVEDERQAREKAVDERTQEAIQKATEAEEAEMAESEAAGQEAAQAQQQADALAAKKKADAERLQQEKKEASAVATEADLMNLGATPVEAQAYRLAQERGLANPRRMVFDEAGKPIGTYEEISSLLADESLTGTLTSKLKGKQAVKTRKQLLEGKTHKQRVQDAYLSIGGGK